MLKQRFKKTTGQYMVLYTDQSGKRLNSIGETFYATEENSIADAYRIVVKKSKCLLDNDYSDFDFIEVLPHNINFQDASIHD